MRQPGPVVSGCCPLVFEWRKPSADDRHQRHRLRFSSASAPGHRLRAPRRSGDASVPDDEREACDTRLLGFRRFGDCFMPRPAGSARTESARQYRCHPRSAMRTGRRPAHSARRHAKPPLLHGASLGGMRRGIVQWKKISEDPTRDRPAGSPKGWAARTGREGLE
jgi:hypothetical protein